MRKKGIYFVIYILPAPLALKVCKNAWKHGGYSDWKRRARRVYILFFKEKFGSIREFLYASFIFLNTKEGHSYWEGVTEIFDKD